MWPIRQYFSLVPVIWMLSLVSHYMMLENVEENNVIGFFFLLRCIAGAHNDFVIQMLSSMKGQVKALIKRNGMYISFNCVSQ